MGVHDQIFGSIGGNYEKGTEFAGNSTFTVWNKNCIVSYNNESSFATDDRYIIIGNCIGITIQQLLQRISIKGIKEIENIQGALVIVDKNEGQLIFFRDVTGRMPLFWKWSNNGSILWSSSLHKLKNDKSKLNIDYLYKYLIGSGYVDSWEDTPYTNIYRVPRGEIVIFNNSLKLKKVRENKLKPVDDLEKLSNEELYELYKNKLHNSIVKRKKSSSLFELSSGLDSTGLVFANYLGKYDNDHSITFVFNKNNEDKPELQAKKVANQYNLNWYAVNADNLLPLSHITKTDVHMPEEPSPDYFFYAWRLGVMNKAKELGVETIISGYGGDELLTGNYSYIGDLLKHRQFGLAWKSAISLAKIHRIRGLNAFWYLNSYGMKPLLGIKQNPPTASDFDPSIHERFILNDFLADYDKAIEIKRDMLSKIEKIKHDSLFKTQLAREMSLIFLPFGVMDSIGANSSIEAHYPYIDKELMEFILGLPYNLLINESGSKILQKNSFKYFFPKDFKRGQENFYYYTFEALNKYWNEIYSVVSNSLICKLGIISKEKVIDFLESWKFGKEVGLVRNMQALISLCLWLKYYEDKEGLTV